MRMKSILALALTLVWLAAPTYAQQLSPGGGVGQAGAVTINNCTKWAGPGLISDAGAACGSGSGGVTSITPGLGLSSTAGTCSGSAITTSGTLAACNPVLTKTGNYTVANADGNSTINCNLTAGCTFTIPQATASGNFAAGWSVCFTSQLGTVTLSPTTSTIYGAGLTFAAGQTECVQSDGTNYLGTGGGVPNTVAGIFTMQSGEIAATRTITAAGAVTVATTDRYICIAKATPAATTVNLFSGPTTGTLITVQDCGGNGVGNNYTITPAAGNIDGSSTFVINTAYGAWTGVYVNGGWHTVTSR